MAVYTEPDKTAGWEPDTPVGDTLLRRYLHNLAASNLGPVAALGGRTLWRDDLAAADLGRPTGLLLNTVVLLRPLDPADAGEVLDALDAFYGAGAGAVSLFSAWPTPDLRGHGWQHEGHPPLLFRPPAPAEPVPVDDPRIVEVDGPQRLDDWCRVAVDGFPFDELRPYRPGSLLDERVLAEPRLRMWVGYDHDRPVCIGSLFTDHGLGQLWLATTLPEARGRGHYRAMVRHRLALTSGVPLAALFSDLSRSVVEGELGFVPLVRFTLWSRPRPAGNGRK